MKKELTAFLIIMMLAGCAMQNDSDKTRAQGAGTGAAIGAIVGAGVGQAIGGDTESTILGAAIGGGVGAAAGYAYGDHVASKKKDYATQEDWLDACIVSAEKVNAETENYNRELAGQLHEMKKKSNLLAEQYKQKKVNKDALLTQKKEIDTTLAQANEKLEKAQFELENQQVVARFNSQKSQELRAKKLDEEIGRLKSAIDELENSTTTLASLSASMAV